MNETNNANQPSLLIQLRIRNERDNTYFMGLSPETDRAIWTQSANSALALTEDDFSAICQKLRGRGYAIQGEVFSREERAEESVSQLEQGRLL